MSCAENGKSEQFKDFLESTCMNHANGLRFPGSSSQAATPALPVPFAASIPTISGCQTDEPHYLVAQAQGALSLGLGIALFVLAVQVLTHGHEGTDIKGTLFA